MTSRSCWKSKEMLLILDSFEQVIGAAVGRAWLRLAPGK